MQPFPVCFFVFLCTPKTKNKRLLVRETVKQRQDETVTVIHLEISITFFFEIQEKNDMFLSFNSKTIVLKNLQNGKEVEYNYHRCAF